MEDFTFATWVSEANLSKKTEDILQKEEANTLASLMALRGEHVDAFSLPVGQHALLTKALANLHHAPKTEPEEEVEHDKNITTKDLAAKRELNDLIASLKGAHLSDLLHEDSLPGGLVAQRPGELHPKPLLIPEFVIDVKKGLYEEDEEDYLTTKSGAKLTLKLSKKKKPLPEEVTIPQWIGASARILLKKIASQKVDMPSVCDYIKYMAKVGDLLQQYTCESVMVMDDLHRRAQAVEQSEFANIGLHTQFLHLEKKQAISKDQKVTKQKPKAGKMAQRKVDSSGKEICINYNQQSGCHFNPCKYSHVCMIQNCQGDHPQFRHDSTPPRFRHPTTAEQ